MCVYGVPERAQSTQKRLRLCGAVLEGVGVSMSGSEVADQSKQQTDMLLGQCRVRAASKQEEEETRWGPARSSVQQSKRTFSPFLPRPSPEFQSGGGGEVDFEGLEKDRESKADPHLAGVGADGTSVLV